MRLITMSKHLGDARLDFYGCPLNCRYCAHRQRLPRDFSVDQALKFLSEYETKKVYLGGAEPALFKKDLTPLIKVLMKRGKEITLKTTGADPGFIKDTLGFVSLYIIEIKGPLDDVETTFRLCNVPREKVEEYLQNLRTSLEYLKGQRVRVMIRVVPEIIDAGKMERIGEQIQGIAEEAHLVQFLGSTNDIPFEGISQPAPPLEEMESLGRLMAKFVPKVIIQGDGFETTVRV
jgi:pyruvate-formate lyase-activating enzyme